MQMITSFFCRANENEVLKLMTNLDIYDMILGQSPNLTKFDFFFCISARRDLRNRIENIMRIRETDGNVTYLGNLLFIHKNKTS